MEVLDILRSGAGKQLQFASIDEVLGAGGQGSVAKASIMNGDELEIVAAKFSTAGTLPLSKRAERGVLPSDRVIPVKIEYVAEYTDKKEIFHPSAIILLNEDPKDERCGLRHGYVLGQDPKRIKEHRNLEQTLQRLVEGRDCLRKVKDVEDARNPEHSIIPEFKEYQFFTFKSEIHYALTTELSYGVPLSYLLKTKDKNPIPDAAKAHISAQICLFLEMANEAGIVHCDIKPDNIVVDPETYNIKIIDFGIAKLVDKKHHYKSPKDTGDLVRKEFNEGTVIGSPHYMAPEQRAGKKLTFKTDLFGTGRTLIELWTGELNAIKGLYSNEDHQQTVRRLENLGLQKSVVTAIVEMLYVEPKYRDDNYARTKFKEMSTGPKPPLDISMEKYLQESDDYTLTMVTRAEDHSQQKAQLQQGIAYLDTIDAKTLDVNIVKLNKIMLKEKPAIIKKTVIESSYRRRPEPTRETVVLYAP